MVAAFLKGVLVVYFVGDPMLFGKDGVEQNATDVLE